MAPGDRIFSHIPGARGPARQGWGGAGVPRLATRSVGKTALQHSAPAAWEAGDNLRQAQAVALFLLAALDGIRQEGQKGSTLPVHSRENLALWSLKKQAFLTATLALDWQGHSGDRALLGGHSTVAWGRRPWHTRTRSEGPASCNKLLSA